jgi:hypothetical protein
MACQIGKNKLNNYKLMLQVNESSLSSSVAMADDSELSLTSIPFSCSVGIVSVSGSPFVDGRRLSRQRSVRLLQFSTTATHTVDVSSGFMW